MKSIYKKKSNNFINSYILVKKHKALIKLFIFNDKVTEKEYFFHLLIMISKLDNIDLIYLLNNTNLSFKLAENSSSSKFDNEMFVLIYLLSIGLI